jgi:molecular chaperone GrpE
VLADFGAWLREAEIPAAPSPAAEPPDWSAVLQQWVALRQEVNLQTRASRAQLEQNAQALEELGRAVAAAQRAAAPDRPDERVRPVLKALLDVADALALGRREVERLLDELVPEELLAPLVLPFWARWLGLTKILQSQDEKRAAQLLPLQQKFDALLVGYQMGLQRLERVLAQQGLEPIACVGEPFDPEIMEVVDVVRDSERDSTEVLEEVRRGYLWNGRVFRFAQVRVARP